MESSMFIGGNVVNTFAENLARYNGSKHCIPCANGTDALQIAMMALGLEPGDEVIVPSFYLYRHRGSSGLTPDQACFVEVDKRTFCIDPASLEKQSPRKPGPSFRFTYMAMRPTENRHVHRRQAQPLCDRRQCPAIGCDYTFSDGTVRPVPSGISAVPLLPFQNWGLRRRWRHVYRQRRTGRQTA